MILASSPRPTSRYASASWAWASAERRLELAIDADFDEAHQRHEVEADTRDELVKRGGRCRKVLRAQRGIGDGVDDLITRFGRSLGQAAPERDRGFAAAGIQADGVGDGGAALFELVGGEADLGKGEPEARRRSRRSVLRGRPERA